ncbi:MAG: winged helix-turn-helix domain-containing protein [Bryobacteraceae bacterium]
MTGAPGSGRIRFGPFDFDPGTRELRRDGVPVRLQPQPAQLLGLLLTRPGEIIARDTLREKLWGTETFVDFNRSLNFCVAQVRSALGDASESPLYIKTLPKRGYQFIAPVTGSIDAPTPELPRIPGRKWIAGAALAATVTLGIFLWTRPTAPEAVIAIASFENLTGDPTLDQLTESLHNSVIADLTNRNRFAVIGNASMLRQTRETRDLLKVHQILQADRIILGSLERGKDNPEVLLQFISLPGQIHMKVARMPFPIDTPAAVLAPKLVETLLSGPYRTH